VYVPDTYWEEVADQVAARDRDARFFAGDDTEFYRRKRALFLERMLAPATEGIQQILEVGCGPGGNLAWLAERGKSVTGVDVSARMLAHARELLPDIPLTKIDGRRLPFADRSFESVMTATVLQHNPSGSADALIAELARTAAADVHLFEDTAWISIRDRRSHWLRTPGWYIERMTAAGFELETLKRLPIAAQEITAALVRATLGQDHQEGAHVSGGRRRVEFALCRAARLLDAVLPASAGLTHMSFRRRPTARASSTPKCSAPVSSGNEVRLPYQ
jgi:SAM-dependent methyltransferase